MRKHGLATIISTPVTDSDGSPLRRTKCAWIPPKVRRLLKLLGEVNQVMLPMTSVRDGVDRSSSKRCHENCKKHWHVTCAYFAYSATPYFSLLELASWPLMPAQQLLFRGTTSNATNMEESRSSALVTTTAFKHQPIKYNESIISLIKGYPACRSEAAYNARSRTQRPALRDTSACRTDGVQS